MVLGMDNYLVGITERCQIYLILNVSWVFAFKKYCSVSGASQEEEGYGFKHLKKATANTTASNSHSKKTTNNPFLSYVKTVEMKEQNLFKAGSGATFLIV